MKVLVGAIAWLREHQRLGVVAIVAGASVPALAPASAGRPILINVTTSEPPGLYLPANAPLKTGAVVAFTPPAVARIPGVVATKTFLKTIAAGPGDQVCRRGVGVSINGRLVARIQIVDSHSRPLPQWRACRRLSAQEYFALSTHAAKSFDSRYYGPINAASIIGVYRRF